MPEGPEVLITSQYLKTKLKNKIITNVEILSGRYTHQKIKGLQTMKSEFKILDVDSKGKFLWFVLSNNDTVVYLLNTLGMSGRWSFSQDPSARIKFSIKTDDKVYYLYYIDSRNFGTVEFGDKNALDKKLNNLAPDVLKSNMSDSELVDLINKFINSTKRDKNLVKILMDQEALVSGIGNYLVAEILYNAKLNPHRSFCDLTEKEIKTLAHSIRKVSKCAYYDNGTGYMEHFETFMSTHAERIDKGIFPNYHPDIAQKQFKFKVYNQVYDPHGNKVLKDEIIKGRTIHWVKEVQK